MKKKKKYIPPIGVAIQKAVLYTKGVENYSKK